MPTVNEALQTAAIDHSHDLIRYQNQVVYKVIALLNRTDKDLFEQIQSALMRLPPEAFTVERLDSLLSSVREINSAAYQKIRFELQAELSQLVAYEQGYQSQLFQNTLPVTLQVASVPVAQVVSSAMSRPFQGRLLSEWMAGLEADKAAKIRDAVRIGYVEGQPIADIVRRIKGTKARQYQDGIIEITRRNAETVVRTAISHTANHTRQKFAEANSELVKGVKWVSTLDGRTSETCFPESTLALPVGDLRCVFRRPWNGYMVVVTTASGKKISATPNHPVLTARGWRPIQEVKPCHDILYRVCVNVACVTTSEDVAMPASISAIFDALNEPSFGDVFIERSSEADFHGDGMAGDYEINRPRSKSHLCLAIESAFGQEGLKQTLAFVAEPSLFSSLGNLGKSFNGFRFAAMPSQIGASPVEDCVQSRFADSVFSDDFGGLGSFVEFANDGLFVSAPHSFASTKGRHDASAFQDSGYGSGRNSEISGDSCGGKSVSVIADDVVSVDREFFSGHVYNLHTSTELYIANGFIVHNCQARDGTVYPVNSGPRPPAHPNCRSTTTYVLKSFKELGVDLPEFSESTRASMDGQVPAKLTYNEWLKGKDAAFQNDVLGPTRAKLFRAGMPVDRFVNRAGDRLTLDALRQRDAEYFRKAGV